MPAGLQIVYPNGRNQAVELTTPEVVIGRASARDASCDVPLDDAIVSRRHARIWRDADRYWLEDLQSKNGTTLNDRPVQRSQLNGGDRIGIGACRLLFVDDGGTANVVLSDTPNEAFSQTSVFSATQRFVLPQQRLERLYELNERLTGKFDRDVLLGEVLDICVELLRFERAGIAVWRGEPHPPQWVHMRGSHRDGGGEFRISRSLVDRALHHSERILVNDTAECPDPTASMISNNIRSAMCVPIAYHDSVRGVIYGDRVTSTGGYTREDIDYFAALGRLGAMGLVNCQLLDELRSKQQVEIQLQLARQIQTDLFPHEPLNAHGVTIDAVNDPGQRISGDYYDYFVRPDGQIVIVIADVSGKGVPAALLTANLQAAVHVTLGRRTDLVESVEEINRLICSNVTDCRFITAIIGVLDPATRQFTSINAGHPPPYLLAKGSMRPAPTEAFLPLGLEPTQNYPSTTIALPEPNSTLVFFTDGVPDAESEGGEPYEAKRMEDVLAATAERSTADICNRLRTSIRQFTRNHPQTDDITILAMRLE